MAQLANLTTTLAIESASFVNGIEQSRGAVRRLVASLDPAAAAQAKFNRQMDLAERGLKSGQLSADLYAKVVDRLRERLDQTSQGGQRFTQSTGAARAAMTNLSYQAQDTFTQLSMGANVFQVIAVQGGQAAGAFANLEGAAGKVAGFFVGPWGLAITGALMLLGQLTKSHKDASSAVDAHTHAEDSLKEAIDRAASASASANHTTRQGIIDDLNAANAARKHEIAVRGLLAAQLARAKSDLENARRSTGIANVGSVGAFQQGESVNQTLAAQQIAAISAAMAKNAEKLAAAQSTVFTDAGRIALRDAAAATDKATAATQRYEDTMDRLQRKFEKGGFGDGPTAVAAFRSAAEAATKARDATLDAIRETDRAGSAARRKASQEARAAAREAVREAQANAKLIADASTDAYKSIADLIGDRDKSFLKGFSVDAGQWDEIAKQADTAFKAQEDMQLKNEEDLRRKRMQDERDIAGLYQDLFTGGTKRIWEDFQQIGFSVISQLLAKWTAGQASGISGGTGGGLLGGLGKLFGIGGVAVSGWLNGGSSAGLGFGGSYTSIAGFANGGSFEFGGKSGIDQNVLSLNGSPIARVSKGETATISNGRASNDNASSIHITVNAEGAVLTDTVKTWVAVGVASGLQEHDRQKAKKAGRSFR